MTFQRTLKRGDLITIGKSKKQYIVLHYEREVTEDSLRGDEYWVNQLEVLEVTSIDRANTIRHVSEPHIQKFWFDDGSASGAGKKIKYEDVKVFGTSKIDKEVKVTYSISNVKTYA